MEKYSKLAGKWIKINHSGYEVFWNFEIESKCPFSQEFLAKAGPGVADGADADDIKTRFELKPDQMTCSFSVGGTPEMSISYSYDAPCENEVIFSLA